MIEEKIYLLWRSFRTNELLTIGELKKKYKLYTFTYHDDALKALNLGCMLPFPYTKLDMISPQLPDFFQRRMVSREMRNRLGITCAPDDFSILVSNHAEKNSDNFFVMSEPQYLVWQAGGLDLKGKMKQF